MDAGGSTVVRDLSLAETTYTGGETQTQGLKVLILFFATADLKNNESRTQALRRRLSNLLLVSDANMLRYVKLPRRKLETTRR